MRAFLAGAVLLLGAAVVFGQMASPAAPAASRAESLPAAEGTAKAALAKSPRHGEYVDVKVPSGGAAVRTWIVYPERKGKAGVVIVIHEVFGLSDWIRAVADQLARVDATVGPAQAEMKKLGKSYEVHTYEGAGHGFLRQQSGRDGANLKAAKQAWPRTVAFLRQVLD